MSTRLLSLALAAVAAAGVAGCSYRNPDIPRVVDPYYAKDLFTADTEWYYRTTVVDAPPDYGLTGPGDGDWLMLERIRWEVTENQLIGWRTYAAAPGTEYDDLQGADDVYKGQPVVIFPIADHFDIRREYDPVTGEEGNVISENREKHWYERQYMRVNWSVNLVPTYKWHIWLTQIGNTSHWVQGNDPGDAKRARFETDADGRMEYMEVTSRTTVEPDFWSLVGFYGPGYLWNSAAAVLDVRHSFMRVPKSDYVAQPMPPSVVLEDENGDEVRDERGFAVRVPINDRFGFFGTLGRNTFDQNRGIVASGQIWNASRFNIWKNHRDESGAIIPMEEREPKPIVYYTNVEHPEALMSASNRVADGWNDVFRGVVAAAQGKSIDDASIPRMFELRRNDCNIDNVNTILGQIGPEARSVVESAAASPDGRFNGTIGSVKDRFDNANDPLNEEPFTIRQGEETQALNDLERICSALEYYTRDDVTRGIAALAKLADGSSFRYQRLGDSRFSLMNLVMQEHQSGWLGLGPPYSDPLTGETISATANIAVAGLDSYAASAARQVGVINGEVDPTDLAFGEDLRAYMERKLLETQQLTSGVPTRSVQDKMDRRFATLGGAQQALQELPPGREQERMGRFVGTALEKRLVGQDEIMMYGGLDPTVSLGSPEVDDELLDRTSWLRGQGPLQRVLEDQARITRMGQRAMDPPEMINRLLIGKAIEYADMSYDERFKQLREDIYVAVQLHEVGHNVGLFHNFAGSSDAVNFGPAFWEIQSLPGDMEDAIPLVDGDQVEQLNDCIGFVNRVRTPPAQRVDSDQDGRPDDAVDYRPDYTISTQECLRQTEAMYSSIMDYHANWNSDFTGLGPYDKAAVAFAYGNLLEVFNPDNLDASIQSKRDTERFLFLRDWRTIPTDLVDSYDAVNDRQFVKMNWTSTATRGATVAGLPTVRGEPANTVPYRFCWSSDYDPQCRTFDFGPDQRTNADNELTRYFQHYFLSHFSRDRLWDWDTYSGADAAINSDVGIMLDFTRKMQWYFFYKATDPEFTGSYAEQDFLQTSIVGLNFLAEVIGHPSSGGHSNFPVWDVFGLLPEATPDERSLAASDIVFPWTFAGFCESQQITSAGPGNPGLGNGQLGNPRAGYTHSIIALGDGRPFFLGLTDEYEEWYIRYIGSYFAKSVALQLLGYNFAWFPKFDDIVDPRTVDISWYRLFPDEVSRVYRNLIAERTVDLGPVVRPPANPNVDPFGTYEPRKLIDPATGEAPDYSGALRVVPSISFNHQLNAVIYAGIYMDSPYDDAFDLPKAMKVAMDNGEDDLAAFDAAKQAAIARGDDPASVVAEFTHPLTGNTFKALKVGDHPIAYDLVNRANMLKQRWERLNACVEDNALAQTDQYCHCVVETEYGANGAIVCSNAARFEPPGTDFCAYYDLRNRAESAREAMDDAADYLGDIRTVNFLLDN